MTTKFAAALLLTILFAQAADAQGAYNSQARPGVFGRTSGTTNNFRRANSTRTSNQRLGLPMTGLGGTAPVFGPTGRNGLPVTSLDSFVLNAGGEAEHIYGDEGAEGLPPYFEFTKEHRIERGITGARAAGLTTGHGSYLPDAWGGDEFVDGPEWDQSGATGGMPNGGFPIPGLPGLPGGGQLPGLPGIGQLPGLPGIGELPGLPNPGQLPGLPNIGQLPGLPNPGQLPGLPNIGQLPGLPNPGQLPGLPSIGQLPGLPNPGQLPGLPGLPNQGRLPSIGQLPNLPNPGQLPGLPTLPNPGRLPALPNLPAPGQLPSFNVPTFGPGGFNISGIF